MSQPQYPQQQPGWNGPQQPGQPQPGWGGPQQPWGPPPQPPKKRGIGKMIGFGCLGFIAVIVLFGIIGALGSSGGDSTDTSSKDKAIAASDAPKTDDAKEAPAKEEPKTKTQAEEFKACVAKSGTTTEKQAVRHVTKVTGTDKRNDILDSAEVYTDFTGGFMSDNQGDAKLIASAFTSCYESKNGLVSVYGKDGDLIANANY